MTTMMKRILAILCSLVMLFSAMPFTAAAEEIAAEPATPTDLGGAEDQMAGLPQGLLPLAGEVGRVAGPQGDHGDLTHLRINLRRSL